MQSNSDDYYVSSEQEEEEEYLVESIRDHRINFRKKKIELLIKWKNSPESENTWQSFELFS